MHLNSVRPALQRTRILLGMVLVLLTSVTVWALGEGLLWEEDSQRLRLGLRLFPACLGALEHTPVSAIRAGAWQVVVVHRNDPDTAQQVREHLETIPSIQGLPLAVESMDADVFDQRSDLAVSAVFIASVNLDSQRLREWSERYRILVFSPFLGDVARGAVAGFHVSERILPSVNFTQAERAGIAFRPFFLQVVHHGD